MEFRELNEKNDRLWADAMVKLRFGSTTVISRGVAHDTSALPAYIALDGGRPQGLVQYRVDGPECEVVTLVVNETRRGIGRLLMRVMEGVAQRQGCRRLWLVTTNDNTAAQAFCRAIGFQECAVHQGAVAAARKLKPDIPATSENGVAIEDEIEFEKLLSV